jgi:dimethylhistidine N-methyltransferase
MGSAALERSASLFARDVRDGLSRPGQKELPSVYLYDEVGTALFDAITLLPEYGLTRADERVLRKHAGEILERLPVPLLVTELGSGSGRKTRWILETLVRNGPVTYYPIDVSATALARCKLELAALGPIGIVGLEQPYLDGLREVARRRADGTALLVLFLGSTIGNFERAAGEEFLRAVRGSLLPGDGLLLGTDLLKPVASLLAAYDDPLGVTAAFNLNLLARINRELGGGFDLSAFAHRARYDETLRRVEMHLVSSRRQTIPIPAADITVTFEKGESIWTEACHKFRTAEVRAMAGRCGFRCEAQWVDPEWPFAESLWIAGA